MKHKITHTSIIPTDQTKLMFENKMQEWGGLALPLVTNDWMRQR